MWLAVPALLANSFSIPIPGTQSFLREEVMEPTPATPADAELVLRLYDLRRESEMRRARSWFVEEFWPAKFSEIESLWAQFGSPQNRWFRQIVSYWEMAAALVVRGALNPALFFDTCGEAWFVYAKLKPFVAENRAKYFPDYVTNLEKVVEGTAEGRERLARIESMISNLRDLIVRAATK
jgi:hypothetical protein